MIQWASTWAVAWGSASVLEFLEHFKFVENILYDIFMVGVSLGLCGIGWTSFFVVGLCNGEMRFELIPSFVGGRC